MLSLFFVSLSISQPQELPDVEGADKIDWNEVECRKVRNEAQTGSRLRRARTEEVCHTKLDWYEIDQAKEELMRRVNENAGTGDDVPGGMVGGNPAN
ncbi:hypothetical protein WJS89_00685 [Sphingomicrobium sp. XHP0235]|uniref:hypothetical protein n=1 Tax=Sphingomicrobium aquimarinum TaxID=3133971 RepID=UPI0031FE6492